MSYRKFDPRGEKPPERSFMEVRKTNPLIVALQLLLVFLLLRVVMLVAGMSFISIPVIDAFLIGIIRMFM